jgi:type VI secretion system protein ImpK
MTDVFTALVGPVLRHVTQLLRRIEEGECPEPDHERARVVALLEEAGRQARASSQLANDFAIARHALVYWVDEVLINSQWSHATAWQARILEWQYFRERNRSDRFFEEAERALRMATTDPIETFFLCVAMGFRGRYDDDPEGLFRWVQPVYQRVEAGCRQPDKFLPEESPGHRPLTPLAGPLVLLAVSVLASLSVLVTVAVFVLAASP